VSNPSAPISHPKRWLFLFYTEFHRKKAKRGQVYCQVYRKKRKPLIYNDLQRKMWCGAGSNRRHKDFQSFALPTELPHHSAKAGSKNKEPRVKRSKREKEFSKNSPFLLCPLNHQFPYTLKNLIRMIFNCSQLKLLSASSCCATSSEEVWQPLK
jgi:hypothetical protein